MKFLALSIIGFLTFDCFAEPSKDPISRDHILRATHRNLIQTIAAMPPDMRRASVLEVIDVMEAELKSGQDYNQGRHLMHLLPHITDDQTLAMILRPYMQGSDPFMRGVATDAASNGRGLEVGKLLAVRFEVCFKRLPYPAHHEADPNEGKAAEDNPFINCSRCLTGLLRSNSVPMQRIGVDNIERFRRFYSVNDSGHRTWASFERDLIEEGTPFKREHFSWAQSDGIANDTRALTAPISLATPTNKPNSNKPQDPTNVTPSFPIGKVISGGILLILGIVVFWRLRLNYHD